MLPSSEDGQTTLPIVKSTNIDNMISIYNGDDKYVISYDGLIKIIKNEFEFFPVIEFP